MAVEHCPPSAWNHVRHRVEYATQEPASFAEFVKAEVDVAGKAAPIATQDFGLTARQLHKFHFAMAANWHVNDGKAGPAISSTQEVVNWISSCARYIKHQFTFVMGG